VGGEKIWEAGKKRNEKFTCLKHFWRYGMASTADYHVIERPAYPVDGRKLPDIYTKPEEMSYELQIDSGMFPLFKFWGPATSIESSQWIARSAMDMVEKFSPTLSLIYLPHLDYRQQVMGPNHEEIKKEVQDNDRVCGELISFFKQRGTEILVIGEYDIQEADRPVHINRVLRQAGYLKVLHNATGELIDFGTSLAFAVADHQVAHVYVQDASVLNKVKALLENLEGIDRVYDAETKKELGLNHPRSGELVAMAAPRHWFTYYYWMDDAEAPDFARTVAIHHKQGYDPCDLILDPKLTMPKLKVAARLLQKKLGFRYVMDVIPLDASLIKGSHGRPSESEETAPVMIYSGKEGVKDKFHVCELKQFVLDRIFS